MTDFSWAPEELRALLSYQNGKLTVGCSETDCSALRSTAGKGAVERKIANGGIESLLHCREHGATWGKFSEAQIAAWPVGHKMCKTCLEVKPFEQFHKHKQALFGYAVECKPCRRPASKAHNASRTFEQTMFTSSKARAKEQGIPHTITIQDIVIPEFCPVLGVKIRAIRNHPYAPSLDQITPGAGYTPDNIMVMSLRANLIKRDITYSEAKRLTEWMDKNSSEWVTDRHLMSWTHPEHQ